MSRLAELKAATDVYSFSKLVGFKHSALTYILYIMPPAGKYRDFEIPKKGGGARHISAPIDQLMTLQKRLDILLQSCWAEVREADNRRGRAAHGFLVDRSTATNAHPHVNRRIVINVDIKDFFGSINFGRVRGFFIKDRHFLLHPSIATMIAQIACWNNKLPQGSPCSPVISNFIAGTLDANLSLFARKYKICYTRYADDITFSTNNKSLNTKIGVIGPEGQFTPGDKMQRAIGRAGFELNEAKSRAQVRGSQQSVTGLIVNDKINVSQQYWKRTRAMCLVRYKFGSALKNCNFNNDFIGPLEAVSDASLEGRLSYITHIRRMEDKRPIAEQHKQQTGAVREYRKFLFFKYFVKNDKPVILCEGKTDNIYLRNAIKRLPFHHPKLGRPGKGKLISLSTFLNLRKRPTTG